MSELLSNMFSHGATAITATGLTVGTLIETAQGARPVETLKLGDLIATLDCGLQPLHSLNRQKMRGSAGSAPIRIAVGVLGNDATLLLSPNHRVLIAGWQAELYFGQDEVLIEARALVNGTTVTREETAQVDYFTLGFDEHQIIFANDAPVESNLPHAAQPFAPAMWPRSAFVSGAALVRHEITGDEARLLSL